MTQSNAQFYVTGGTLRHDAPSYVERQADKELIEGLVQGEFCYVLTTRQMGKSSLMVRTAVKLREQQVAVAVVDLTAIGQNLTPEQWYDGLILALGRQLRLEDELEDYWLEEQRYSAVQRFFNALRDVVLKLRAGQVVIFVDEIDAVRSLPFSTDEFFAAIRECYNRRSEDPILSRLTFCLLGVARPSDLIRDTRTTPFNIGRRIELNDFTTAEAAPLAQGLGASAEKNQVLLQRVLYWTGGHPYLTQRFCRKIAEANSNPGSKPAQSVADVDQVCQDLYLSNRAREKDDNLLFVRERMLRSDVEKAGLLYLYLKVLTKRNVPDDERNPLVSSLRLTGIVRVEQGFLRVRNRIYGTVFDRKWAIANMPDAEVQRQREAFRRGLLRGAAVGLSFLIVVFVGAAFYNRTRDARDAQRIFEKMERLYSGVNTYQDQAEIKLQFKMTGMEATFEGASSLVFARSNRVKMDLKISMGVADAEMQAVSDGQHVWSLLPSLREYSERSAPPSLETMLTQEIPSHWTFGFEECYRLLAAAVEGRDLKGLAMDRKLTGRDMLEENRAYQMSWRQRPFERRSNQPDRTFPVKAWIDKRDGTLLQMSIDLSSRTAGNPEEPQKVVCIVTFKDVRLNQPLPPETFTFTPPADSRKRESLASIPFERPAAVQQRRPLTRTELLARIPAREADAPARLLDLTPFYNAALNETWHPGSGASRTGNDLSAMPKGLQSFAGTLFDVRGLVQLDGQGLRAASGEYPHHVRSIPVRQKCQKLSILHGAGWSAPVGTPVCNIVAQYADGELHTFTFLYGKHVVDWWEAPEASRLDSTTQLAWKGANAAAQRSNREIHLFKTTLANPWPEKEIKSIGLFSAMAAPAPFFLGISLE